MALSSSCRQALAHTRDPGENAGLPLLFFRRPSLAGHCGGPRRTSHTLTAVEMTLVYAGLASASPQGFPLSGMI